MPTTDRPSTLRRIGRVFRILLFVVFGLVLLLLGAVMMTVKMLTPDILTPLVGKAASSALEAKVDVRRVELGLRASWPMVTVTIDSLALLPNSITELPADRRAELPQWADTLAAFNRLRAGINLSALAKNCIDITDVEITAPRLNVLIVNEDLNNISIFRPSEGADTAAVTDLPDLRLRSFSVHDPRPIRFVNMADTLSITASLSKAQIERLREHDMPPEYVLTFDSDIDSPLFTLLGMEGIPVSFSGDIAWDHDNPYAIALSRLKFGVSIIHGEVSTKINFNDHLIFETLDLDLGPINVAEGLAMIPDSTARSIGLPRGVETDGEVSIAARLNAPYDVASTSLPEADMSVSIPPCMLRWQKVDLRQLALEASLHMPGGTLDDATLTVERLLVSGPATTINLNCTVTRLLSDPIIDGKLNGRVFIDRLPPLLKNLIPGHLSGVVSADGNFLFSPSMFALNKFYQIQASGKMNLTNMSYATHDSSTVVYVPSALLKFGTNERREGRRGAIDSILSASVTVDTARIRHKQIKIRINDVKLGVGAKNVASSMDTTTVTPLGGSLTVGSFALYAHADSAGMRLRGLKGSVGMVPLKGHPEVPRLTARLEIDRLSAGDRYTRFMLTGSSLRASTYRDPDAPSVVARRQLKARAEELRRLHPGISADSAMALASSERKGRPRRGMSAVQADSVDLEVINWHSTKHFRRFLNEWKLDGTLKAQRARLFTGSFPVRNRMNNFNVTFDTDSVLLHNLQYKAGHSDFLISGRVSNMKRAFTSLTGRQALKVRFDVLSDTIDINELSHAFFTGAAASDMPLEGTFDTDDESGLERDLEKTLHAADTGPLLIPTNIDAEIDVKANNVLYSDLMLHNMQGSVLAYDGALNLNGLKASSSVGAVELSGLYSAPSVANMQFGFGMKLERFDIANFLKLVPAIDSLMPLMRDFGGIIDANIAATAPVDKHMNINLPLMRAAINLSGDSLTVIDPETFRTMAKWLFFKDKHKNMIDHMSVEMLVEDGQLKLFPFMFDFDRYRIGVQGHSDMALNLDYHVAVLKSPLPFKFGINIRGNVDHMKIRLGRARFNEKETYDRVAIVDTTRVNLLRELENVFRRGVRNSRFAPLNISSRPEAASINLDEDTLTRADSIALAREGLIPSNLAPN